MPYFRYKFADRRPRPWRYDKACSCYEADGYPARDCPAYRERVSRVNAVVNVLSERAYAASQRLAIVELTDHDTGGVAFLRRNVRRMRSSMPEYNAQRNLWFDRTEMFPVNVQDTVRKAQDEYRLHLMTFHRYTLDNFICHDPVISIAMQNLSCYPQLLPPPPPTDAVPGPDIGMPSRSSRALVPAGSRPLADHNGTRNSRSLARRQDNLTLMSRTVNFQNKKGHLGQLLSDNPEDEMALLKSFYAVYNATPGIDYDDVMDLFSSAEVAHLSENVPPDGLAVRKYTRLELKKFKKRTKEILMQWCHATSNPLFVPDRDGYTSGPDVDLNYAMDTWNDRVKKLKKRKPAASRPNQSFPAITERSNDHDKDRSAENAMNSTIVMDSEPEEEQEITPMRAVAIQIPKRPAKNTPATNTKRRGRPESATVAAAAAAAKPPKPPTSASNNRKKKAAPTTPPKTLHI